MNPLFGLAVPKVDEIDTHSGQMVPRLVQQPICIGNAQLGERLHLNSCWIQCGLLGFALSSNLIGHEALVPIQERALLDDKYFELWLTRRLRCGLDDDALSVDRP